MAPLRWMVGGSAASWLAVTVMTAATETSVNPELLLGMLGPLGAVSVTWIFVERTYASSPERLPGVLIAGFAVKMIFFGAYVTVMLRLLAVRPVLFVVSFTSYFIALYVAEALFLRRLTVNAPRAPRS